MTTWIIEQVNDVYFLVSTAGDRLEAGHSRAVAEFALTTLNSGVAAVESGRDLNPYKNGRWSN